jgi:fused signal recognition particle receptor
MLGGLWARVKKVARLEFIKGKTAVGAAELADLEEVLIEADFGALLARKLVDRVKKNGAREGDALSVLKTGIVEILEPEKGRSDLAVNPTPGGLTVYMVVGVNGVGKTTTIAKLAHRKSGEGKKVMLAAADTFRAGAIEQLVIWGERAGVPVLSQAPGADPSAVVFDAIDAALARRADILICDTSGRLHTKREFMDELSKMKRVIAKKIEGAPQEVLLVLDATTGQNAVIQARVFREHIDITGIILVKLDGTAKGGTVVSIAHEFAIPVKMVGLGEGLEDLVPFDPAQFVEGLFS